MGVVSPSFPQAAPVRLGILFVRAYAAKVNPRWTMGGAKGLGFEGLGFDLPCCRWHIQKGGRISVPSLLARGFCEGLLIQGFGPLVGKP